MKKTGSSMIHYFIIDDPVLQRNFYMLYLFSIGYTFLTTKGRINIYHLYASHPRNIIHEVWALMISHVRKDNIQPLVELVDIRGG